MIIDKKRINKEIEDNALWVIEQIPGLVQSGDQTPILRAGESTMHKTGTVKGKRVQELIQD